KRSIKDLQLVGLKEQHLHSVQDYVNALKLILSINDKAKHLDIEGLSCEIKAFLPILKIYQLVTLRKEVDLRCLPTGYNTSYPPQPGLCNKCKLPFIDDNGIVFICGYAYHLTCYHRRCIYCEKFYKKGVDLVDDDNMEMETKGRDDENSGKIDKTPDILSKLTIEINQIEN
ncbi:4625_t:CDS:2, partial [Funneliformis geosporum]